MKKLMTSFATIVLISSSIVNTTFWKQKTNQTLLKKMSNIKATNEDVEDIANKLFAKTIKIDPNVWLDKDIKTNSSQFNAAIVKDGILTPDEAQYVSWNTLNINYAGWYWNKALFTIKKDSATATGYATVNADPNLTIQQITDKLENTTIKFNYDYWNGKAIQNYSSEIRKMLVNEQILTKAEASDVGADGPLTIANAGKIEARFDVNDNNNEATANVKLNILDDGNSAAEIANYLHTVGEYAPSSGWVYNYVYFLKENTTGLYADNQLVYQNFYNILHYDIDGGAIFPTSDIRDITLPHVMLTNSPNGNNMDATVTKDGQIVKTLIQLVARNTPYINSEGADSEDFAFDVNLNPQVVKYLKNYFLTQSGTKLRLAYFYQVLDDGDFSGEYDGFTWPSVSDEFFSWSDRLQPWYDDGDLYYGPTLYSGEAIAAAQSNTSDSGNLNFEQALYNKIINAPANAYIAMDVIWYCPFSSSDFTTTGYNFW